MSTVPDLLKTVAQDKVARIFKNKESHRVEHYSGSRLADLAADFRLGRFIGDHRRAFLGIAIRDDRSQGTFA